MQEMRMKPLYVCRQFNGQDQSLAEPPRPVGAGIAFKISPPGDKGIAVIRPPANHPPSLPDTTYFLINIFWQVIYRRLDFFMDGMNAFIGWMAQRDNADGQALLFQFPDFLGDKSLRQAWVAFENDCR